MPDWRQIPSLSALRAFETAIRTGSLKDAADALNVTHAAISQHVRALEADFGIPLVDRGPRGVTPTPEGRLLSDALTSAFTRIEIGVTRLREEVAGRPLTVACTPTFAENWLMPRLGAFWTLHPDIEITLKPSAALADVAGGEADLAIRYGQGNWPGLDSVQLTNADFVVVAAPSLAETNPDLCRTPWYFQDWDNELRGWAKTHGLTDDETRFHFTETNALTLAAIRAGLGLSAQTRVNVEGDLDRGTLIALMEIEEPEAGYHIVTKPGHDAPGLKPFVKWLRGLS
ncbi:LysR family transcriptional regulator [Aestuariibius sp. 2305UL40-4]|uniref:LysR family transcriptional regulator n=1 Tax=Aestuariibius violaceus TaxID=3234132 RepID=UPI00345E561E